MYSFLLIYYHYFHLFLAFSFILLVSLISDVRGGAGIKPEKWRFLHEVSSRFLIGQPTMRRYVWRILVPPLLLFSLFAAHVTPSDPQHGPQERAEALDNGLSAIPDAAEVGEEEEDSVSVEEEASDLDTLREELNQGHGGSGTREEGPGGNDLRHSATRLSGGAEESLSVTEGQRRNATGSARRWGSHPLPPLEEYIAKRSDGGASWTAYFHDQAIAIIQQTHEGTVLNCTLQEVMCVFCRCILYSVDG